ncbi:hypothetical protein MPTK1_7g02720 [Marchantia polymorpha subsp. ruderalis]|nr:hypothetical protein MARPO_0088s0016 [Marchantia polymorpha]BBN16004.1 hypothetical protein Mp_7g02720 [Marchantia polymorpha subsp. ruderalis]|eukprot:PTQ33467.1 hypothetical protein MARPO_0088s0016 [Marchantia polymorpha]
MAEREGAVIRKGNDALECAIKLLEEVGLPGGLLPLKNVIESGHVKETGYVWITQEEEINHVFKLANKQVKYGTEIKGYLEKNRLRDLHGVKAKEMILWAPIHDISIPQSQPAKIAFKSIGGLGKVFNQEVFAKGQ